MVDESKKQLVMVMCQGREYIGKVSLFEIGSHQVANVRPDQCEIFDIGLLTKEEDSFTIAGIGLNSGPVSSITLFDINGFIQVSKQNLGEKIFNNLTREYNLFLLRRREDDGSLIQVVDEIRLAG